ncbi:MAG TPA: hypothetical protein DDZ83_15390 [Nitrospinae bacterium]|nr:hypothetical protein [Nitrospinota bacterium]
MNECKFLTNKIYDLRTISTDGYIFSPSMTGSVLEDLEISARSDYGESRFAFVPMWPAEIER